ncbi:hypothetical protein FBEOM_4493 [Fusarium beomiforme]|uniref:Uncharacterized protein n=1 Tax=Fusarium beomiforme TaxID=44412 RepID=A0A9P5DY64_9HYPO|nr:hypothetical protein FBEOM_4493 [Fusarium beomiforme]
MPTAPASSKSSATVNIDNLVFKHEIPVKRFCKPKKLNNALREILGSEEWVVEVNGKNAVVKVSRRIDLVKELKEREIIFESMGTARAVHFFELFEPMYH